MKRLLALVFLATVPLSAQVFNNGITGTASGDLSGKYPLPTVSQAHWSVCTANYAGSPYSVPATCTLITCDATAGAVVITLPAATGSGRYLNIKKVDSTANACTPTRAGSDTIDGATSYNLTVQYASSALVDSAAATWYRTHVNQVGGMVSGISTNQSVQAINLAASGAGGVTGLLPAANIIGNTYGCLDGFDHFPCTLSRITVTGTNAAINYSNCPTGSTGVTSQGCAYNVSGTKYLPPVDGNYCVSETTWIVTSGASGTITVYVSYYDLSTGARNSHSVNSQAGTGAAGVDGGGGYSTFCFHSAANKEIQAYTTYSGDAVYSFEAVLTRNY